MFSRLHVGIALLVVGLLCMIGLALSLRDDGAPDPIATGETGSVGLAKFYGQKVTWKDCGADRCTWAKVPVDYDKPAGETLRLRVKIRPSDSKKPIGRLFLNPGGPGGSGVDFVDQFAPLTSQMIRKRYDMVGFDPRGVGASTPLTCLSNKALDDFNNLDPDPDDDAEAKAYQQGTAEMGQACGKNSGELAEHVTTLEAAKDMDVLRAVLGEKKLDYYGASYGTQLGATYAQLFPKKVGKMILDGAVDPSLNEEEQAFGQTEGFQRALQSYIRNCVKSATCPLGNDRDAAEQKLSKFMDDLDKEPLKTNGDRKVTEAAAFYGIALTLYDRDYWPALTAELTQAFNGDGTSMLYLADQYFGRRADGSFRDNSGQSIYAIRCLDSADRSTVDDVKKVEAKFIKESPVFGRELAWSILGCADWPFTSKNTQVKVNAEGAAPMLVVGTTRDPATPYEWAEALAKQLVSGVLVTREGDGHTAYHAGNPCIDSIIDRYLLSGVVPKDGVTCRAPTS